MLLKRFYDTKLVQASFLIGCSAPVVVHCQSVARSAIAASVFEALGRGNILNRAGRFAERQKQKQPVDRG